MELRVKLKKRAEGIMTASYTVVGFESSDVTTKLTRQLFPGGLALNKEALPGPAPTRLEMVITLAEEDESL